MVHGACKCPVAAIHAEITFIAACASGLFICLIRTYLPVLFTPDIWPTTKYLLEVFELQKSYTLHCAVESSIAL